MSSLPTTTVIGNLVADPEFKIVGDGVGACRFRIACTPRIKNDAGEWVDGEPTFLTCTAWRQQAENVAESLKKGNRVVVIGRLKQRSYETREGEKRTVIEVEADEVAPTLKWATAVPNRVPSSGGGGAPVGNDPWASGDGQPPF